MSSIFKEIKLNDLLLDPENPRLPDSIDQSNERDVLNWMVDFGNLPELMASIIKNGYFQGEPIIVLSEASRKFVVIEGNRRLSALKLLENPSLQTVSPITIRDLSEEAKQKNIIPNDIWCYIVNSRQAVKNYLGFKHVTGVKAWPVMSKARYLYEISNKQSNSSKNKYVELAKEIGSKPAYIKRLLYSYQAYLKIKSNPNQYNITGISEDNFDLSRIADSFNHRFITDFIGLDFDGNNPFDNLKEDNFTMLVNWLYAITNKATVVGDSRNLRKLNKVLELEISTQKLMETGNLIEAFKLTSSEDSNFSSVLVDIVSKVDTATILINNINEVSRSDYDKSVELDDKVAHLYKEIRKRR